MKLQLDKFWQNRHVFGSKRNRLGNLRCMLWLLSWIWYEETLLSHFFVLFKIDETKLNLECRLYLWVFSWKWNTWLICGKRFQRTSAFRKLKIINRIKLRALWMSLLRQASSLCNFLHRLQLHKCWINLASLRTFLR